MDNIGKILFKTQFAVFGISLIVFFIFKENLNESWLRTLVLFLMYTSGLSCFASTVGIFAKEEKNDDDNSANTNS